MIINQDNNPENGDWMFRCDASYIYPSRTEVYCSSYRVIQKTPKGKWILSDHINPHDLTQVKKYRKFVLDKAKKKFAHNTREEARLAFIARKIRQTELLEFQLQRAKDGYIAAGGELPIETRKYYHYED